MICFQMIYFHLWHPNDHNPLFIVLDLGCGAYMGLSVLVCVIVATFP